MRGELDWIVMKALEKDRDRRYETGWTGWRPTCARYLDDEAVQAQFADGGLPPGASKFAKKYLRGPGRRRAFVVVLVGATVTSVYGRRVRANLRKGRSGNQPYAAGDLGSAGSAGPTRPGRQGGGGCDGQYELGRAAVDDYLTTVSESRLLKSPLPGLQPLRKELLTTALKYYEDFVNRHQGDAVLQADLAAATLRVGEITDQIGSQEEALKTFQTPALRHVRRWQGGGLRLRAALTGPEKLAASSGWQ